MGVISAPGARFILVWPLEYQNAKRVKTDAIARKANAFRVKFCAHLSYQLSFVSYRGFDARVAKASFASQPA